MAILTYNIQKQEVLFSAHSRIFLLSKKFYAFNSRGIITGFIMSWIAAAVLCYLIAVYSFFGINASIHHQNVILKQLVDAKTQVELSVQQKQAGFAQNNQYISESMEKISEIRYVTSDDVSVSRLEPNGQTN